MATSIAFVVWVLLIANAKRTFKILDKKVSNKTLITIQVIYMIMIISTTMMWGKVR